MKGKKEGWVWGIKEFSEFELETRCGVAWCGMRRWVDGCCDDLGGMCVYYARCSGWA